MAEENFNHDSFLRIQFMGRQFTLDKLGLIITRAQSVLTVEPWEYLRGPRY